MCRWIAIVNVIGAFIILNYLALRLKAVADWRRRWRRTCGGAVAALGQRGSRSNSRMASNGGGAPHVAVVTAVADSDSAAQPRRLTHRSVFSPCLLASQSRLVSAGTVHCYHKYYLTFIVFLKSIAISAFYV